MTPKPAKRRLDYYNHNLISAPDFTCDIITTRDFQGSPDTLSRVAQRVKVCSGGIVGMGRPAAFSGARPRAELANLSPLPLSRC
jgi:biotin synthase